MNSPLLAALAGNLVGRKVTFVRLAANSLLVYIECEPGDEFGFTVWLDPTWHVVSPDAVLAGSRQAQVETDEHSSELEKLTVVQSLLDPLIGRAIVSVRCEPVTNDLRLSIEGGFELRAFVSDPTDDHNWHIRDNATRQSLRVSSLGFSIR